MKNRGYELKALIILALVLTLGPTACVMEDGSSGRGIHLVEEGEPSAVIVIADDATRSAQFAAGELRHHVELITGAVLPVVSESEYEGGPKVLVGESGFTREMGLRNEDFKNQEYVIKFLPGTIVLMGRDADDRRPLDYETEVPGLYSQWGRFRMTGNEELATCYAVYDFLERYCGVRWYLPTRVGKVFPEKQTLYVSGEDIRRAPAMKYRAIARADEFPASLTDYPDPERELISERERRLYMLRQRLTDIEPYRVDHAFYGYYRRYIREHPEWFAQGYDDGVPEDPEFELTPGGMLSHSGYPVKYYPNMCYTNEGFIDNVIKRARSYFDTGELQGGEAAAGDFFSVGPMDSLGEDKICRCADCQALLHTREDAPMNDWRDYYFFWDDRYSDYFFLFTNEVARGIAETHPDKYVTQLAYHQNYYPPTLEPVEPNVAVSYCIHAQLRVVPAMDRAVSDLMDRWDEAAPESPKYLWLYFHRPGRADPFFPGFCARDIVRQMEDYHRRGIKGIFSEPTYMSPAEGGPSQRAPIVNMLEIYLAYKLADNPGLCGEELIDEFFGLYYGAAGEAMQELYEAIEGVYSDPANYRFNPHTYIGYQTEDIAWGVLGTPERMERFGALMERAKAAAESPMEKERVELFEVSVWNRMKEAAARHAELEARRRDLRLKEASAPLAPGRPPAGDPALADWAHAGVLGDFRTVHGEPAVERQVEARVLHDGEFLYFRLEEVMDTSDIVLHGDGNVWGEDVWEIVVGAERDLPYRQIGVNADGVFKTFAYGEESGRSWDSGAEVISDKGSPHRWVVKMSLPFEKLFSGGARTGQTIYINIFRNTEGDIDTAVCWNPTFVESFHVPSQMGALKLSEESGVDMERRLEGE